MDDLEEDNRTLTHFVVALDVHTKMDTSNIPFSPSPRKSIRKRPHSMDSVRMKRLQTSNPGITGLNFKPSHKYKEPSAFRKAKPLLNRISIDKTKDSIN